MSDEFAGLDAISQAELIRGGEVSPLELVERSIDRIEALNPKLNAVIHPLFEKARKQAADLAAGDAPFRGVPIVVKDLVLESQGDPLHAGMRFLKKKNWRSTSDSFLAQRLRKAGFIFVGKTNTAELGVMTTTEPKSYGVTHNPWKLGYSPGGSSGGSAAAVAAHIVAVGHANDGGGSIRIPASSCGLVGLKPSRGRNSLGPRLGQEWGGAVAEHVLSRTVRDTAAILDCVSGPMPGDPYFAPPTENAFLQEVGASPGRLRIGVMPRAMNPHIVTHPECAEAALQAARWLETLGHDVQAEHPKAMEEEEFSIHAGKMICASVAADIEYWSQLTGESVVLEELEEHTRSLVQSGREFSAVDYVESSRWLDAYTRRLANFWSEEAGFDLLLTPTLVEPPPPHGDYAATSAEPQRGIVRTLTFNCLTSPFNVSGQPAISLPLASSSEGLPIGVQLVAAYGREDLLLRVAAQLEADHSWAERRPLLCA